MRLGQTQVSVWFVVVVCVLEASVVLCDEDAVSEGEPDAAVSEGEPDDAQEMKADRMPGSGRPTDDAMELEEAGVGEETRFKFDPHNPKNVALVSWAGAMDETDADAGNAADTITVGTFIATNVIVCVPSAQIPVRIQNTSNWYVQRVVIGSPPTTIDKGDFVVIYHEKFQMTRDSAHRLAMLVLNEQGEAKAAGMVPLLLTAVPFLPSVMTTRHDDFVLQMCSLIVYEAAGEGKFAAIPFVTTVCRFNPGAKNVYKEKVCGYTKMMKQTREVISEGIMFPNDLGAPLVCGNVLVGVYSGIQNLHGNRYKSKDAVVTDLGLNVRPDKMGKGEQYTFDVPGGLENYEFLAGFVDQKAKKMKWSMKMPMHETNECIEVHEDENTGDGAETDEGEAETPEHGAETDEGGAGMPEHGAETDEGGAGMPEHGAEMAEHGTEMGVDHGGTTEGTVPS